MNIDIITREDLNSLKEDIIKALKPISKPTDKKWLRSSEVRKILGISSGTLQKGRINNTIPYTKVGTTYLYDYDKINEILVENSNDK